MFKKSERLTKSEFTEFFKTGRKHHYPICTIVTVPLPGRKVAVVVGKKILKSAAKRSVVRRRVYAGLREILDNGAYQGVLIVVVKPKYVTLNRKQAALELKKALTEALDSFK
jgi:ribonuclease P protein component